MNTQFCEKLLNDTLNEVINIENILRTIICY